MLVSVIIPTHNRAHTLLRALDSVANQTYSNWELIIVDDGSTDETPALLEKWLTIDRGQNVQTLRHKNSGVSRARNQGVAAAKGDWIAFLDSDDEWLSHRLERQIPLTADFKWIHGEEIWIRNGQRLNPKKKHQKSGGRIFNRCVELCCVSPSAALLNKSEFLNLGGFREDFPVCEDYDLWLRFAARHPAGFVAQPLITKYGGHEDQLSHRFKAMDYWRALSLKTYLENEDLTSCLTSEEHEFARASLVERLRILEIGFKKHGGQDWPWAGDLSALTASQSDHSAAERRPRSESSGVL